MLANVYRFGRGALLGLAILGTPALAQEQTLTNGLDKLSYALGMDLGTQLRRSGIQVNPEVFAQALVDGLAGNDTLMTPDDAKVVIRMLQAELERREAAARAAAPGTTKTDASRAPAAPPAPMPASGPPAGQGR